MGQRDTGKEGQSLAPTVISCEPSKDDIDTFTTLTLSHSVKCSRGCYYSKTLVNCSLTAPKIDTNPLSMTHLSTIFT